MRTYYPITVFMILAVFLSVTAFQCGSTEMTTAKLAMKNKQYDKAEESLVKATQKDPQDEEAWFLLGQVRLELKKYAEMNEAYEKTLSLSPLHKPEIDHNRAAVWQILYNRAIQNYEKGTSDPSSYDSALVNLRLAMTVNPDSTQTYYAAALVLYQKKEDEQAIPYLQKGIEKDPKDAQPLYLLGDIHLNRARGLQEAGSESGAIAEYEKAADVLEKAFRLDPSRSAGINNLLVALERSKQDERGLQLTSEVVAQDPNNASYRFAYGVYLLKREKFPESIAEFKKAAELDSTNADYAYNCGAAYLNWGVAIKKEADKLLEQQKGKKGVPDVGYREKLKEGLPYLEMSTRVRPDDAQFWESLAKAYTYLGMTKESEQAFKQFDRLTKPN
jgi:tetratricopeptide (TPR) repeat protein